MEARPEGGVTTNDPIRVFIGIRAALLREALRTVLSSDATFLVVGDSGDGAAAVAEVERLRPDVALLEADLPGCDGVETIRAISDRVPTCRVMIQSAGDDEHMLMGAVEAGATAYLLTGSSLADIAAAVRAVHHGEALIPPRMLGTLLHRLIQRSRERERALNQVARLTKREREVLAILADGGDNDTIASRLFISPETARTHIQKVLEKLGVHSRLRAVAFVTQNGLMDDLVTAS